MDEEDEDTSVKEVLTTLDGGKSPVKHAECKLAKSTQELMRLIFDNDMFSSQMKKMDIDVKKMPLG